LTTAAVRGAEHRRKIITMTTTTILVHTSAASAVRHSCQHGWHRVEIDTSTLTPDERELLASRVHERDGARYDSDYDVAPPTVDGLVAHLRAALAERAAETKRKAEREAELASKATAVLAELETWRTRPIGDLLYNDFDAHRVGWALHATGDEIRAAGLDPASSLASALGRSDELRAEIERRKAARTAEREAAKAEKERVEEANRAKLREIVQEIEPELLPVLDANRARVSAVSDVLVRWACAQIGVDPNELTGHDQVHDLECVDPVHYAAEQRTRAAAARLGDPDVQVVSAVGAEEGDDEPYDGELLVLVRADVAGRHVYLEIPLEHTPR
jgi:hypothetical protein